MANIFNVAGYILQKRGSMTAMKLQKLCYYSQAWSLVWDNRALFPEDFQAWTNGPVCRELYDDHKGQYIVNNISLGKCSEVKLTDCEKETIDSVLETYGDKEPQWLSTLTHMERPWNEARIGYADGENCEEIISEKSMREYYASL